MASPMMIRDDQPGAAEAVAQLLRALGEDPRREGLEKTPERVARTMAFLTSGTDRTPFDVLNGAICSESRQGLVLAHDIHFYSLCEKHLLPFLGRAHIAYIPQGRVIEKSRLPRLLDLFARRLQVQERLTDQVARAIQQAIEPRGVAVRLEATHFCMMMRGVEKQASLTMTSSFLGAFDRDLSLRREFVSSLSASRQGPCPIDGPARTNRADAPGTGPVGACAPGPAPVPPGRYPREVESGPRLRRG